MTNELEQTSKYLAMSASERRAALAKRLTNAALEIVHAANIYAAMVTRGDDCSYLPTTLRHSLSRIAAKTLLPEVWTQYEGTVRRKVGMLPLSEQRRALDGALYPVVETGGGIVHLRAEEMSPAQIGRLIDDNGKLRSVEGQQALLPQRERVLYTVTTRHPRSKFGVPVILRNGKWIETKEGAKEALAGIRVDRKRFAEFCGVEQATVYHWFASGNKLPAAALNVLRDLLEDYS